MSFEEPAESDLLLFSAIQIRLQQLRAENLIPPQVALHPDSLSFVPHELFGLIYLYSRLLEKGVAYLMVSTDGGRGVRQC